jgi:hypothetical protein
MFIFVKRTIIPVTTISKDGCAPSIGHQWFFCQIVAVKITESKEKNK